MRILIVEDDAKMAGYLKKGLEEEGCSVELAGDGEEGLELGLGFEFDVVVLDVMLPKMDGFEVVRRLRQSREEVPVLMLTARDAVGDIVSGLNRGADDYLTKPFSFEVLLARLRAIARRGAVPRPLTIQVGNLALDPARHEVYRDGEGVQLTRTEFKLLEFLMRRSGRVVPRETIIEAVWGVASDIENNTLDAFIRLLRRKIREDAGGKLIHTVRGVGYSIREEAPE